MKNLTFRTSCICGLGLSARIVLGAVPVYTLWRPERPISVPGATSTEITGINNNGTMVGTALIGTTSVGFVQDPAGTITTFTVPFAGATGTFPQGINDAGDIAGYYTVTTGTHGFTRIAAIFQSVDIFSGGQTLLYGLSNSGQTAATYTGGGVTHSAVYNATIGNWTSIHVPTGTQRSAATGVSVNTNLNLCADIIRTPMASPMATYITSKPQYSPPLTTLWPSIALNYLALMGMGMRWEFISTSTAPLSGLSGLPV